MKRGEPFSTHNMVDAGAEQVVLGLATVAVQQLHVRAALEAVYIVAVGYRV